MWIIFALLAGTFYSGSGLLTRHILKQQKDAWAFSFFFSAFGALVSLPFFLTHYQVGESFTIWAMMFLVGLLIVTQNFFNFKSSNYIEASVTGIITRFRLVWVFLLGIFLLGETFSWQKLLGTVFTVFAGLLLAYKRMNQHQSFKGIIYAFTSTFFYATVIYFYKLLFSHFSSQSLTFFIFFIPALLNLVFMPNSLKRIGKLIKSDTYPVALACSLGGFANLSMNYALSIGEASRVLVVMESFLVVTLVGEHIFLKESAHFKLKLLAVIAAIIGAILIQI